MTSGAAGPVHSRATPTGPPSPAVARLASSCVPALQADSVSRGKFMEIIAVSAASDLLRHRQSTSASVNMLTLAIHFDIMLGK